jgi:Cdc6-like AAA superfamily ATPase
MSQQQATTQPYKMEEIREILDAVESGEFDADVFSRKFKRSPHGLKMVVWFRKKYQKDPEYVKKFSRNMYEHISRYQQEKQVNGQTEKPNRAALLVREMDEHFKSLQGAMNEYIDRMVEEKVAQEMKTVTKELTELREFKERAKQLLG